MLLAYSIFGIFHDRNLDHYIIQITHLAIFGVGRFANISTGISAKSLKGNNYPLLLFFVWSFEDKNILHKESLQDS